MGNSNLKRKTWISVQNLKFRHVNIVRKTRYLASNISVGTYFYAISIDTRDVFSVI